MAEHEARVCYPNRTCFVEKSESSASISFTLLALILLYTQTHMKYPSLFAIALLFSFVRLYNFLFVLLGLYGLQIRYILYKESFSILLPRIAKQTLIRFMLKPVRARKSDDDLSVRVCEWIVTCAHPHLYFTQNERKMVCALSLRSVISVLNYMHTYTYTNKRTQLLRT